MVAIPESNWTLPVTVNEGNVILEAVEILPPEEVIVAEPNEFAWPALNPPSAIFNAPEKVLLPLNVEVPVPPNNKVPAPDRTPE